MSAVEWVNQAVGHQVGEELNRLEAEMVTAKIKSYVGVAWVLLYEAHARKAHRAMGYSSWAEYVEAEFDMGKSHSYRLISQAKIVLEISEAVSPMGDTIDISERTARDLTDHDAVDAAKAAVVDAVSTLVDTATDAQRAEAAKAAVEKVRYDAVERARERRAAEAAAAEAERLAAEMAGQNEDGEVFTPGSEPREDEGGSDDAGASAGEGGEGEPRVPTSPPSAPVPSDAAAKWRSVIDSALVSAGSVRRDLDPERITEFASAEQRNRIASNVLAFREWCDAIDEALQARPNLKAV